MATKKPFAVQAAQFSWLTPLIALAIGYFGNNAARTRDYEFGEKLDTLDRLASIAVGLGCLALILGGLGLGIYALLAMKKHGRDGILKPAITGIVLNLLFLGLFTLGVVLAMRHP